MTALLFGPEYPTGIKIINACRLPKEERHTLFTLLSDIQKASKSIGLYNLSVFESFLRQGTVTPSYTGTSSQIIIVFRDLYWEIYQGEGSRGLPILSLEQAIQLLKPKPKRRL